jgi:hypothetical protein
MVAKSSSGHVGAPFEMHIELGKIDEFARATHGVLDAYLSGAASPPTFLQTDFFWKARHPGSDAWEQVQMSEERGMHAEQEYIFHGPPPKAGDVLIGTCRISDVTEKTSRSGARLEFVKMTTEYRDKATGELVAEAILTGVERWPAEATA